jgi:2-polyprenyl-3-methyl-5-hydroxy-6-metoxy-1,4-benzoquinol methylase
VVDFGSALLGSFDIATIHNVLLHLRDPFLAMKRVTRLVQGTLILSDIEPWAESRRLTLLRLLARRGPIQIFYPQLEEPENTHTC